MANNVTLSDRFNINSQLEHLQARACSAVHQATSSCACVVVRTPTLPAQPVAYSGACTTRRQSMLALAMLT